MRTEYKRIIDELYFCEVQCIRCFNATMGDGKSPMRRCIQLTQDCAAICRLTAQLMERESENAQDFLRLCADICMKCAAESRQYQSELCQGCADACLKCAALLIREHAVS